jgi:hypothetical protein
MEPVTDLLIQARKQKTNDMMIAKKDSQEKKDQQVSF